MATMHRSPEALCAAMNWGMAQKPPLFKKSPFHRFGVRLNKKMATIAQVRREQRAKDVPPDFRFGCGTLPIRSIVTR